jgi:hypothetical protein
MFTCARAVDSSLSLAPSVQSPVPCLPKATCLAIADFNRDGRPDIAAVNRDPGDLLILLNAGDGRFGPPPVSTDGRIHVGSTANGLAVADIDRDQAPDLLVCFHDSDAIAVLRGRGDGRFDAARMQPIMTRERGAPHVHNLVVVDLNRDGHLDVIMNQADDNEVAWALGKGDGTFAAIILTPSSSPISTTTATRISHRRTHSRMISPSVWAMARAVSLRRRPPRCAWPGERSGWRQEM